MKVITLDVDGLAARVGHGEDVGVGGAGLHLDGAGEHPPGPGHRELERGVARHEVAGVPVLQQEEGDAVPVQHLPDVPRDPDT